MKQLWVVCIVFGLSVFAYSVFSGFEQIKKANNPNIDLSFDDPKNLNPSKSIFNKAIHAIDGEVEFIKGLKGLAADLKVDTSEFPKTSGFILNPKILNEPFTLLAWIKLKEVNYNTPSPIFSKATPYNSDFNLTIQPQSGHDFPSVQLRFDFHIQNNANQISLVSEPFEDGNWMQVAVTYNDKNVKLYLKGALVDQKTISSPITNTADDFRLGLDSFKNAFIGQIDEVKIYGSALSANEVKQNYQSYERLIK